ncbi:hypothetical protein CDAR_110961 [Caerostris darwini]|uniref:Uncharacterized protein n=1 Tax=Caerostris darwini TaxID=1538125 RepID=A0AAV4QP31_9ARAC|nr:hypothetical protein CDAR_110961 [Caerostris darwini]
MSWDDIQCSDPTAKRKQSGCIQKCCVIRRYVEEYRSEEEELLFISASSSLGKANCEFVTAVLNSTVAELKEVIYRIQKWLDIFVIDHHKTNQIGRQLHGRGLHACHYLTASKVKMELK